MDPLFWHNFWFIFQRRRHHHHQSKARQQKQHETTKAGVTEGCTWRITWGSIKNRGKHKLVVPTSALAKLQAGSNRRVCLSSKCLLHCARLREWPDPTLQVSVSKLVWGSCICLQFLTTGRRDEERGGDTGESCVCDNSYIVRAGTRKWQISAGENRAGGGNLKEASSWPLCLVIAPEINPIVLLAAVSA